MHKNDVREIWVTVNVSCLLRETGCDPGNCGPLPYIQIKMIRAPLNKKALLVWEQHMQKLSYKTQTNSNGMDREHDISTHWNRFNHEQILLVPSISKIPFLSLDL